MDMLGQVGNICWMNASSSGVPMSVSPSANLFAISGRNSWNALRIESKLQMNIPEFHRKSPLCRNTFASSRFGFSVNAFTLQIPLPLASSPFASSPICIYPYPVSGRVGFMPKVSRASWLSMKSNPCWIVCLKVSSWSIRWSLGATTILALLVVSQPAGRSDSVAV